MRKSNKKIVASTAGTSLHVLSKFSKQQKTASKQEIHKLLTTKYTRSISSFGNNVRETPEKKNMIFHHKVKSNFQRSNLSPLENVGSVFAGSIKSTTEDQLLRDVYDRFHVGMKAANENSMSQQFLNLLDTFKTYTLGIIDQMLLFQKQKLTEYYRQIQELCKSYEERLKKQKKQAMRKIQQGIVTGNSELGHKIATTSMKAMFSTKIFNQMELSGIDIHTWMANSDLMHKLINRVQYGLNSAQLAESAVETPRRRQKYEEIEEIDEIETIEANGETERPEVCEREYSIEGIEVLEPVSKTYR